jgi:glycosyltransferase involved in cell wall biosynthesis
MSEAVNIGSDITGLLGVKYATGIQRVIVETHKRLFESSKKYNFNLKGLNFTSESSTTSNKYILSDPVIQQSQDNFDGINLALELDGSNSRFYSRYTSSLIKPKVISLIHDLMPITHPNFYYKDASTHFRGYLLRALVMSDCIIVTSNETRKELTKVNFKYNGAIELIPLGAYSTNPVKRLVHNYDISLLVIATLEPKKGYREILDAFDILRSKGLNVLLTIVGVYGWNLEEIRQRITNHECYNNELVWLNSGISDDEIDLLYGRADIVIASSYVEGFGFAIEEGLVKGVKVIARDIPVFKERPNSNLFYFHDTGENLAMKIIEVKNTNIDSELLSTNIRTMDDFSRELLGVIKYNIANKQI